MQNNEIVFEINNLQTYFPIYEGFLVKKKVADVKAVDNVSFTVKRGETLGIVGESGCGKTTLGKSMMMLQKPTGGEAKISVNLTVHSFSNLKRKYRWYFKIHIALLTL